MTPDKCAPQEGSQSCREVLWEQKAHLQVLSGWPLWLASPRRRRRPGGRSLAPQREPQRAPWQRAREAARTNTAERRERENTRCEDYSAPFSACLASLHAQENKGGDCDAGP